jgi:hypothetical protein
MNTHWYASLFLWTKPIRKRMNPFWWIKTIRKGFGHDEYSAVTFDRLVQSEHVEDLRWIVMITFYATFIAVALIILMGHKAGVATPSLPSSGSGEHTHTSGENVSDVLMPFHISAVLAGFGGIIAWCYQIGSARLGIVDLFACEITTVCRICSISGLVHTCIAAYELGVSKSDHGKVIEKRSHFRHFDSSEDYTPVFNSNAKDLAVLSAKVVTNITAFYAYWKATRDSFRRLANIPPDASDLWQPAMRNLIFMQFLALESARKAVRGLIEYEPHNAENTIIILLSELLAFRFLLQQFPEEDVRYRRLQQRQQRYKEIVGKVYYHTENERAKYFNDKQFLHLPPEDDLAELRRDWDKAFGMLKDLQNRYEAAFGEFPSKAILGTTKRLILESQDEVTTADLCHQVAREFST